MSWGCVKSMSNFDELVERLERIEAQTSWLVAALKALLSEEVGTPGDELEAWLDDEPDDIDTSEFEFAALRRPPTPPACPHNHQVLVGGVLKCGRCGLAFVETGMAHGTVSPNGAVRPDPNPPAWVNSQSPGASSKNPGGPLVPHHDL